MHTVERSGTGAVVCYLADARSPLVHRWLLHFVKQGYEVHIISIDPQTAPLQGVTVHHVHPKRIRIERRAVRYLLALPEVRRILRRLEPDIVHAHYGWGYGIVAAFAGRSPLVVSLWGTDILVSAARSRLSRLLMKAVLFRADRICATSTHLVEATRAYTNKRILRTPFGVDCITFSPRVESSHPSVLTIGMLKRLDENSGIETLLRAFALILGRLNSPLHLRIIGASSDDRWHSLAFELGIADSTSFEGHMHADLVPDALRDIDVLVQPSLHTEGFGVAVLEAAATGIPVVASNLGGLREVVMDGETGILVPAGDVEALADALCRVVADGTLRARMRRAGREFAVDQYNWSDTVMIMDGLYLDLLTGVDCES